MSKSSKGQQSNGTNRDDVLIGGIKNDTLNGGRGNDRLFGLAGNDRLSGGDGSDLLDGGSGSDILKLGSGDDVAIYRLSENSFSHDEYDGGNGFDTLRLEFTAAEWAKATTQTDIARFLAFMANHDHRGGQGGPAFKFTAFDLDARNFEALRVFVDGIEVNPNAGTNRAPVASADDNGSDAVIEAGVKPGNASFSGDVSATGNVLANDTDADSGDTKTVSAVNGLTDNVGTLVTGIYGTLTLAANGVWTYVLNNADSDTNALAQGIVAQDIFNYTMRDSAGATSSSTLTIAVSGSNDAPIVATAIADQTATEDEPFSFTVATNVFVDADRGDSLVLSATLANGDPLPAWLTFNPETSVFSGMPLDGDVGEIDVRVTATDSSSAMAFESFKLSVVGINTAPTDFSLQSILESLPEDTATTLRVKVADITYQDDAQGTETFALTGPHATLFEIDGTEVFLKAGTTLDFELNPALFLNIDVFDLKLSSAPLSSLFVPIRISDVRDGPSVNVSFGKTELAAGATTATSETVASFSVRDDALGSHIATLSGRDAARFTLIDQSFGQFYQVKLNAGVTLDANDPPLSVTFSIDDPSLGDGAEFEQTLLVRAIEPGADEFSGILFSASWPFDFITYSFDTVLDPSLVFAPAPGLRALDEAQRDVARAAFQQWTESSGVNFIEAPSGLGLIHVGVADLPQNLFGFAFFPPNPGTIVLDSNLAYFDTLTWLHEIGHTLGLKHSFEQPAIDRTFDSTDFTVMSYTVGTNQSQLGLFDVQAAQFLYGAEDDAVWSWDINTLTLTQTSDANAQELKGISFTDVMSAGAGNDTLFGFDGDDTLSGGGGDDALNGGAGVRDVAVYSGHRNDYSLTLDAEGRGIITDLRPGALDGTDTVEGIERIRFADGEFGFLRLVDPSGNEAPVARDDRDFGDVYIVDEDSTLTIDAIQGVLINDSDSDFDLITAALVVGPTHGNVVLNRDGSFVYTPNADFFGADSFTYRTSDGLLESNTAMVAIFVNPTDDPIIVENYSLAVNEDSFIELPFDNNGATSADSQTVFIHSIAAGPEHGLITFDPETAQYRYTPNANFNGVDSATVFLSDGLGDLTPQVLTFDVAPVNDAPVFGGEVPQRFVGEGIAESGTTAVSPVDFGDGLWRLTSDSSDVAGAIWDEVDLSQSWTWTTEIALGFNGAAGGDGLAFVLQSQGENALTTLDATVPGNHTGDTLGIGSEAEVHGLPGAFGIRIDTKLPPLPPPFQNFDLNTVSFFQNDAIGISQTPVGSSPTTTLALDTGFGPPLGLVISWDASTATLSYVLSTQNGDIAGSQVFDRDTLPPGQAYFGFAAATSGATNEQFVRMLSVTSDTETISLSTVEDTPISGSVSATDIDGDSFKFILSDSGSGMPAHGSVAIDEDTGAFTYTPDVDFVGDDSFLVTVNDGSGGIDAVTVRIGIHHVNDDLLLI